MDQYFINDIVTTYNVRYGALQLGGVTICERSLVDVGCDKPKIG